MPYFKILSAVVPEKSLTNKKFTHTPKHTNTHSYGKDKNYIPLYTLYTGDITRLWGDYSRQVSVNSVQWFPRRGDNNAANVTFYKVQAGNQTTKFVNGPEFLLALAQLDNDTNTITKFQSNPFGGFQGDMITRKIQVSWQWPYLSMDQDFFSYLHWRIFNLAKFWKNLPSGLGGDAVTRKCLQTNGQTDRCQRKPHQKSSIALRPEVLW